MTWTPRRLKLAAGILVIFVLAVGVWSVMPLHESLNVGTDVTPTLEDPPGSPQQVTQVVECNNLWASSPGPDNPLPELTPQPPGVQPLGYPREPCVFIHGDARRALAIDVLVVVLAVIGLGYVVKRRRSQSDPDALPTSDAASLADAVAR
jgi:hypothetical protein